MATGTVSGERKMFLLLLIIAVLNVARDSNIVLLFEYEEIGSHSDVSYNNTTSGNNVPLTTATATTTLKMTSNTSMDSSQSDDGNNIAKDKEKIEQTNTKRKFFLIHIGPYKTGTSTIQFHSSKTFRKELIRDDVVYVGRYQSNNEQFIQVKECLLSVMDNINQQKQDRHIITKKLQKCFKKSKKYKNLFEKSIVDSDEGYTRGGDSFSSDFSNSERDIGTEHLHKLQKIFVDYLGYDKIIIVGAYRRYYEWLPSMYRQFVGNDCLTKIMKGKRSKKGQYHPCVNIWEYLLTFIQRNQDYGYDRRERTGGLRRMENIDSNLIKMLNQGEEPKKLLLGNIDVKIIKYFIKDTLNDNEYKHSSVTTEFYCSVLGMELTHNTCKRNKKRDKSGREIYENSRTIVDVIYDDIVMAATQKKWIKVSLDGKQASKNPSNKTRDQARKDMKKYHLQVLLDKIKSNETEKHRKENEETISDTRIMTSLPLKCPPENELQMFLNKSLEFESLVMQAVNNNDDNYLLLSEEERSARRRRMEQQHEDKFWDAVNNKKVFCWVDIDRLFGNANSYKQLLEERLVIDYTP